MKKKGWIRIFEAVLAVLLIAAVLLIVINQGYIGKKDISEKVHTDQLAVLREIELDDELRTAIVSIDSGLIPLEDNEEGFPESLKERITERIPDYLECKSKLCLMNELCALDQYQEGKDIYAQNVAITATSGEYSPKQLKLFCWVG